MCDINAYFYENGQEELLMESVDKVIPAEFEVCLENIYGHRLTVEGRIKELSLFDHRIILEQVLPQAMNKRPAADLSADAGNVEHEDEFRADPFRAFR